MLEENLLFHITQYKRQFKSLDEIAENQISGQYEKAFSD